MAAHDDLIITATARLARRLTSEHAERATASGQSAWRTPSVMAFSLWLDQLMDDYFLDADDARTPLSRDQALAVWRSVIESDVVMGAAKLSELAQRAWDWLLEHQLPLPNRWPEALTNLDSQAFQRWSGAFQQRCSEHQWIDRSQWLSELPERIDQGRLAMPKRLVLTGFALDLTPLQQRVIAACERAGCKVLRAAAPGPDEQCVDYCVTAATDSDELMAAASWARQRLEQQPEAQIAIIVHDLSGRIAQAERALRRVFELSAVADEPQPSVPWHISLGPSLKQWPLTADALHLLQLNPDRLTASDVDQWLRSPFVIGWSEEGLARAETLMRLAQTAPHAITLFELARDRNSGTEQLGQTLTSWRHARSLAPARALPSAWTAQFQTELNALGFGRGRALNSIEYQLLSRWQRVLETFSALDAVQTSPINRAQALGMLSERMGRTVFRERNRNVPIEVMGLKEAIGARYDAIWLTSMGQERWPLAAQREPLIPGKIQLSVAAATSDGRLQQCEAELEAVLQTAQERVFSCSQDQDSAQANGFSPMLDALALQPLELNAAATPLRIPIERIEHDSVAPAAPAIKYRGGTGLLQAQSDLPFDAFVRYRLNAVPYRPARPGLDAGIRGSLVHRALETFWHDLSDSNHLKALSASALAQRIEQSAEQALRIQFSRYLLGIGRTERTLEQQRLTDALTRWIELELKRPDFRVLARELPVEMVFGGVQIRGTIDRVDGLIDASQSTPKLMLIDYKTGASASSSRWAPQLRMLDVQLPAYALSMEQSPHAIAFARIRPDRVALDGVGDGHLSSIEGLKIVGQISGQHRMKAVETWSSLTEQWQTELDRLGRAFAHGQAEVDPRDAECLRRHRYPALSRIHERIVSLAEAHE
ncbi:MAG: PD-(D/E)XK nuclease family protein [Pseudomonadota bacterium]